jgi:hypothetical protein
LSRPDRANSTSISSCASAGKQVECGNSAADLLPGQAAGHGVRHECTGSWFVCFFGWKREVLRCKTFDYVLHTLFNDMYCTVYYYYEESLSQCFLPSPDERWEPWNLESCNGKLHNDANNLNAYTLKTALHFSGSSMRNDVSLVWTPFS